MRPINFLLSILVSLGLAFLVFELGLRLFPQFRPQETINQFDPKLGWSKEPDRVTSRETSEFDIDFEINSLGLRDDEMSSTAKPENTFRVVTLGDSFVLGYTVDRKHLFVDHLERWWQAENRRVDVINGGTEGYSTDQEVAWFLEQGQDFNPDLVLIFPYENDIYWNGQTSYNAYPKPRFQENGTIESGTLTEPDIKKSALSKFAIGRLLETVVFPRLRKSTGPRPHTFQPAGAQGPVACEFAPLLNEPPDFLADCVARTRGALRALKERCDERGVKLVMVPIPSESAIHADRREGFAQQALAGLALGSWSPDRPVDQFLTLARELDIQALDPREALRAAGAEESLYFDKEWHFNPRGNEVFATFLHDELDALGAFSEGHGALAQAALEIPEDESGTPFWMYLFGGLWALLGTCYAVTYRKTENPLFGFLKVGGLLALVFSIFLGLRKLLALKPEWAPYLILLFATLILGFVAYKLGRRLGTIAELLKAFTLRGHWYLMPLVVVLLTIGSLLVVAASSPLIAPFIYTLF